MNISFELTAHARFVNSGGTRWCWKPSNEYVQLDFGSRSTFLIRDEDDIKSLRSDSYGLPTVSNFPLVDALMLPDIGIQMTISKSHDVSVNSLPKILKILGIDESAFKMVFVVASPLSTSPRIWARGANVSYHSWWCFGGRVQRPSRAE